MDEGRELLENYADNDLKLAKPALDNRVYIYSAYHIMPSKQLGNISRHT